MDITPPSPPPLYQRVAYTNITHRAMDLLIFFLFLSLITLRLLSLNQHGVPWVIAFLCESWLTFTWLLNISARWNPVDYKTYPENLSQRIPELPTVDMFVTTADPNLEPPVITINTVLSLLAVDYPPHKLACYISDDAASLLTFFSLVETIKFAKLWVPFCKKYKISTRAPFRYFDTAEHNGDSYVNRSEFQQQRQQMKAEYEKLLQIIEDATDNPALLSSRKEFEFFSGVQVNNYASIVKVLWENKGGLSDGLPHVVYIAREKRPKYPHYYKGGAMNVLTRVSGVMTNAPFMLNVDCDMYANNPLIVMHAMCLLLGISETESAFVQSPQFYYSGPKETMQVFQKFTLRGFVGLGVVYYQGTGCFHRRRVIYGVHPEDKIIENEKSVIEELQKGVGKSLDLTKSVALILSGSSGLSVGHTDLSSLVDEAHRVAGCNYEHGTQWGNKVGWLYGSVAEDILTGMMIHSRGWKSVSCTPNPPAFLGCAPSDTPGVMSQQRRWTTGKLEILLRAMHEPLLATLNGRLRLRGFLAYLWWLLSGLKCIVDLCYVLLPAYCIITDSYFLPKGLGLCVPLAFLVIFNMYKIWEFRQCGASVLVYWNVERMNLINSATSRLFGLVSIIFKLLGLSQPVFEITEKVQSSSISRRMTFYESPVFVPATTLTLVHLASLGVVVLGFHNRNGGNGSGIGEIACSVWVVMCFWPFVEGLFRKGSNGIPGSIICKSAALALLFVHCCRSSTSGLANNKIIKCPTLIR